MKFLYYSYCIGAIIVCNDMSRVYFNTNLKYLYFVNVWKHFLLLIYPLQNSTNFESKISKFFKLSIFVIFCIFDILHLPNPWSKLLMLFYVYVYCVSLSILARKSEIIRSTELLLEAISSNDFESYAYVYNCFYISLLTTLLLIRCISKMIISNVRYEIVFYIIFSTD